MSSPSSPYLQVGQSAHHMTKQKVQRRQEPYSAGVSKRERDARAWNHVWKMDLAKNGRGVCRLCGQPKFVVYGQPCAKAAI